MYCNRCGKQNNDDSKFCSSCGSKIGQAEPNGSIYDNYQHVQYSNEFNKTAIAGFVISLAALFIPYLGFLISIAGLIFSIFGLRAVNENYERGKGLAIAGIVLGILGPLSFFYQLANL